MSARYKDINDCLRAGVARDAVQSCVDSARDFAPEKVRRAGEYRDQFMECWFDQVLEQGLEMPFAFPWRVRTGETTVWTGIEKSGKTTMLSFVLMHLLSQGERAMVASFEVRPVKTLKKYSRQAFGDLVFDHKKNQKDKKGEIELEGEAWAKYQAQARVDATSTLDWLDKGLWLYDHVGIAQWREVLDDFRWARRRHGITQFVLDNFMRLGIVKDDYAQQADCMTAIVALAMDLNVHIHVVVHQNKSEGHKGFSGKRSVAGAFEIIANAHNIVEVTRDVQKGEKVSDLFQNYDVGKLNYTDFKKELDVLEAVPDGKFILHAQRDGEEQNASKYLYFLWRSQQYSSYPKTDSKQRPICFVSEAEARAKANSNELPTNEELGI